MTDYLTGSLPGTGGSIKECPEDFFVAELPLYEPCGEGEHLYFEVEKSGLTTMEMVRRIASALNVKEREIGYAGLKDARATTRQQISIAGVEPEQAMALKIEGAKILSARRHGNKLRLGHLAGNRFRIRLRGVVPGAKERAEAILAVLREKGVPNLFGEQRYGILGNSHLIGRSIVRGDFETAVAEVIGDPQQIKNERWRQAASLYRQGQLQEARQILPQRMRPERGLLFSLLKGDDHRQAFLKLPRNLLRLYLSAYQSCLFDRLVGSRLQELGTLMEGDVAYKHANGACFRVESPELEQERADRFEISPTAPLFGRKSMPASGTAGEREQQLLAEEGLCLEDFNLKGGLKMEGERRPMRFPLSEVSASEEGEDLLLGFCLPRGSYATSVLREVVKDGDEAPESTYTTGA